MCRWGQNSAGGFLTSWPVPWTVLSSAEAAVLVLACIVRKHSLIYACSLTCS